MERTDGEVPRNDISPLQRAWGGLRAARTTAHQPDPDRHHRPARFRTTRTPPDLLRLHRDDLDERNLTSHDGLLIVGVPRTVIGAVDQHVGWNLIDQAIDTARRTGRLTAEQADGLRALRPPQSGGAPWTPRSASARQPLAPAAPGQRGGADADMPASRYRRPRERPVPPSHGEKVAAMAVEIGLYTDDVEVAADAPRELISDTDDAA